MRRRRGAASAAAARWHDVGDVGADGEDRERARGPDALHHLGVTAGSVAKSMPPARWGRRGSNSSAAMPGGRPAWRPSRELGAGLPACDDDEVGRVRRYGKWCLRSVRMPSLSRPMALSIPRGWSGGGGLPARGWRVTVLGTIRPVWRNPRRRPSRARNRTCGGDQHGDWPAEAARG